MLTSPTALVTAVPPVTSAVTNGAATVVQPLWPSTPAELSLAAASDADNVRVVDVTDVVDVVDLEED